MVETYLKTVIICVFMTHATFKNMHLFEKQFAKEIKTCLGYEIVWIVLFFLIFV